MCAKSVHDTSPVEAAPRPRSTSFALVLFAWLLGCGMTALASWMYFQPEETETQQPITPPKSTTKAKTGAPENKKLRDLTAKLDDAIAKAAEHEKQTKEAKDVQASLRRDIALLETKMAEQQKLHSAKLAEMNKVKESAPPMSGEVTELKEKLALAQKQYQATLDILKTHLTGQEKLMGDAKKDMAVLRGEIAAWERKSAEQQKQYNASLTQAREELDKARMAWEAERRLTEAKWKSALDRAMIIKPDPAKPAVIAKPDFKKMEGEERAKTVRVDKVDGTYVQTALVKDEAIKLVGRARKLRIEALNGTAFLDTTGLTVEEIEIPGGIHGFSRVRMKHDNGKINIGDIAGSPMVDISGANVRVTIRNINGDPKIAVRSKRLEAQGSINGNAQLFVTLTSGGKMDLKQVLGTSRVIWSREHSGEPNPQILVSEIAPGAVMQQVK